MFKKIIVVCFLLLFLSSCSNNKQVACSLDKENKAIYLDIDAINDDICSMKVRAVFVLPNDLMADESRLEDLIKQLDDSYHFEDNQLVREYEMNLEDTYSLNKTIEHLRKEKYYCE